MRGSRIDTCSKDSPLILAARQADREIDDCVGKWQPGEKLTCKWWRVRERRGRDVCGVSS